MKYLGLDLGSRTLGLAISDALGMFARAYDTLRFEDDDYDYLASKWDPTHMSRDEYKEFVSYLRDKGIISDEEKRYLDGERIATSGQSWVSFDYPTPVEYGDENVLEYMRYEASLVYEHRTTYTEWGKNLSKKIVSILEKMERRR